MDCNLSKTDRAVGRCRSFDCRPCREYYENNKILNDLKSKVEVGMNFSHVIIRKSGGGPYGKGYFDFDAYEIDNLIAIKEYIQEQIEYLRNEVSSE